MNTSADSGAVYQSWNYSHVSFYQLVFPVFFTFRGWNAERNYGRI